MENSPRAGGDYSIGYNALQILNHDVTDDGHKARITTWLVDQRRLGNRRPMVTPAAIEAADSSRPLSVHERADRMLRLLSEETKILGDGVHLYRPDLSAQNRFRLNEWAAMAVTESTAPSEVSFLLSYLDGRQWIYKYLRRSDELAECVVTADGYERIADLDVSPSSAQGFVAMWFDPHMAEVRDRGIKPGVEDAGYEPLVIDEKNFLGKIDDQIIAEIRRSRFLVADFTHGDKGIRGAVCYEAGFAHGLNIPVIFTCKNEQVEGLPFDTRQYPHILWKDPDDLREQLTNRIRAILGDGPEMAHDRPPPNPPGMDA